MPYTYHVEDDLVWVKYFGRIDAHDMIAVSQDQAYLAQLRKLKKVVYDYLDVTENLIVMEESRGVADITKLESYQTEDVSVALLPSDEGSRLRMEHYIAQLECTSWTFTIFTCREEAKAWLLG